MWHPWFSESVNQWLLNKHRCWSGKQSEVKSWWAQKSTTNQPLNQLGYFEKCAVFWSRFVFSCSELIWRLIKLECRNEETMQVPAYTGTQRTQAHEQERPTRAQDTILPFSGAPSWAWTLFLFGCDSGKARKTLANSGVDLQEVCETKNSLGENSSRGEERQSSLAV